MSQALIDWLIEYVTNAALDSKLNNLKSQHITDEVKKVDDKAMLVMFWGLKVD